MYHIHVFIDRRLEDYQDVRDELNALQETVSGLSVIWQDSDIADDGHKYRDFAPFAEITHEIEEALDIVVEELVDLFGWKIDCRNRTKT